MTRTEPKVSRWTHFRAWLNRQVRGRRKDTIAIFVLAIAGIVMMLGIFTQQKASLPAWLPLVGEEFEHITAEFSTAQAVTPGQGQAVDIAGIQIGKVASVDLEDGHAVVGMDIEPKYMELIHPDASFLLRPKTNLNDMIVEIEPGTAKGHVEDGDNFTLAQTEPNTNLDAFLATLDARHPPVHPAAGRRRRTGHRRPRQTALQRASPLPALRPLHGKAEQSGRRPARRARPGHPQLRPADHRTRSPRRRGQALRHLLQGRARQLRQPAGVGPGRLRRVPRARLQPPRPVSPAPTASPRSPTRP